MHSEIIDDVVQDNRPWIIEIDIVDNSLQPHCQSRTPFGIVRSMNRDVDLPGTDKRGEITEGEMHFCGSDNDFRWFRSIKWEMETFRRGFDMTVPELFLTVELRKRVEVELSIGDGLHGSFFDPRPSGENILDGGRRGSNRENRGDTCNRCNNR